MKPHTVVFIISEQGYYPEPSDTYDAFEPNWGNSNYGIEDKREPLFWDTPLNAYMDVRLFYVFKNAMSWSKCRWDPLSGEFPRFWTHSKVTNDTQICYTPEALHYAQGAYLVTIVVSQWGNNILCKTRTLSFS